MGKKSKSSRIKVEKQENPDGTINLDLNCKHCGKPIVQSNSFGMYCENKCGLKEDKEAFKKINKLFGNLFSKNS